MSLKTHSLTRVRHVGTTDAGESATPGERSRRFCSRGIWPILTAAMPLLLVAGCAAPVRVESNRPLKYIHGLRVNPDNGVRYCARMSEPKGEARLRRLTETSQFEEIWLYIPALREWQEIGINEGNEIVDEKDPRYRKRSVELEGDYLDAVARQFKQFTVYHTHNVKRRINSNVIFYNPQSSLPSYEDLHVNLKILTFYDRLNQGHSIRFKSVSPVGVTEVKFSQWARDHFEELATEERAIRDDLLRFENFDFYQPARFSTFKGEIDISYTPLIKDQ